MSVINSIETSTIKGNDTNSINNNNNNNKGSKTAGILIAVGLGVLATTIVIGYSLNWLYGDIIKSAKKQFRRP